ncbi:hypothetical protein OOT46_13785 [Aquabacterium sp. A7-Y]|uniref:hypothetical protein n=1 Tax=Aquabacterium sp. A7-Y TaxID=1349605 RepID=UPI00223E8BBE|nr:hypothetical protein [Aquabacterium sp. A7-Y]MCW7538912.1 hypothetical protein [Aquabacterium sp. A7-Y]
MKDLLACGSTAGLLLACGTCAADAAVQDRAVQVNEQISVAWRCAPAQNGDTCVELRSMRGRKPATDTTPVLRLSFPLLEDCDSAVVVDDDVNNDGTPDLSVFGDSSLSTSTRAVVLVTPGTGSLLFAGNLPVAAEKLSPGVYVTRESAGDSVQLTTYRFQGMGRMKTSVAISKIGSKKFAD